MANICALASVLSSASAYAEGPEDSEGPTWDLKVNPLALLIGRYSADFEFVPLSHMSVTFGPHYWSYQGAGSESEQRECNLCSPSFQAWGGELGIRAYPRHAGAKGFFIGGTLVVDRVHVEPYLERPAFDTTAVNGYVDVGTQMMLGEHWFLGIGGGLGVLRSESSPNPYVNFPVRLLLQIGFGG